MNTLEKFVNDTAAKFKAIDKTITGYERKIRQLNDQIEDLQDDLSIEAAQQTNTLRADMATVNEALTRAKARRKESSNELSADIRNVLAPIQREYISSEQERHSGMIAEMWEKAEALRRVVWQFEQANQAARTEYCESVKKLEPYVEATTLWHYTNSLQISFLNFDLSDGNHFDAELLRFVKKKVHGYDFIPERS